MTRLSPPIAFRAGSQPDRTGRYVLAARGILLWERIWPALWPASGIAGLFVAAALFDLFAGLPWPLHALILAGIVTACGLLLYFNLRDRPLPGWRAAARRLEIDSGLAHRPISEADDRLAAGAGDPWAEDLWRAHLAGLRARVKSLRLSWPRSDLVRRDPHGLRFAVLALMVAGALVAGHDWQARIAAAFGPDSATGAQATLDAWIDPPPYTGEAPVYLSQTGARALSVPAGSTLNLRVHGASHAPSVTLDGTLFQGGGDEYHATAILASDANVRVRAAGRTIGHWRIRAVPDEKPVIAFAAKPARTDHDALKLSYTAGDDYGVVAARAIIRPHGSHAKPLIVDLELPQRSAKTVSATSFSDLTAHPYAGLKVDITLEATDGAGQKGRSKTLTFTLPARVFTDPLARALIEQRQALATRGLAGADKVLRTLGALAIAPDKFYQNRMGVYFGLRQAFWALKHAHDGAHLAYVEDLLWQIASNIERGGMLAAAEELRKLQAEIGQALMQGAPQDVIDALLQRYQQAMQRYMRSLAENPPAQGAPPPGAKILSPQDLATLLRAIQQLSQAGDRVQAAEMLTLLQSLLENMHMAAGSGAGTGSPGDKALSDAIQKLGDLTGRERGLIDKTFRQKQGTGDPRDGGAKGLSRQQGGVRGDLGKVLQALPDRKGKAAEALGRAGRAMNEAEQLLGQGDLDGASQAEKNALDALNEGAGQLARSMMPNGQGSAADQDPLGRTNGAVAGRVKIPDSSDLERARSILRELRKRAGEENRPKRERDYIDRLLQQF